MNLEKDTLLLEPHHSNYRPCNDKREAEKDVVAYLTPHASFSKIRSLAIDCNTWMKIVRARAGHHLIRRFVELQSLVIVGDEYECAWQCTSHYRFIERTCFSYFSDPHDPQHSKPNDDQKNRPSKLGGVKLIPPKAKNPTPFDTQDMAMNSCRRGIILFLGTFLWGGRVGYEPEPAVCKQRLEKLKISFMDMEAQD